MSTDDADTGGSNPGDDASEAAETAAAGQYIDDPDFPGTVEAVRDHYRRIRSVYERFGDLDGAPTTGFFGNSGWYRTTHGSNDSGNAVIRRRAYTFEEDYDRLVEAIRRDDDDSSWRSAYNIVSWKDRDAVYSGIETERSASLEQGDGLAGYDAMRGFPLWVDLDLRDNDNGAEGPNYKRRRGNLRQDVRQTVERAYEAYVEEFAELCGISTERVAVLDSGGGGYLYTPAAVTLPVAERYRADGPSDEDQRAELFKELRKRLFAYGAGTEVKQGVGDYGFEGIQTRVNDRVDGAADLLEPDWMQNRNRQSKAPLAIHGDHDIVVTPARPVGERDGIEYEPTLVSAVDDDLIEHTAREAEKIVTIPDRDVLEQWTEQFVATLFPDMSGDSWRERLDAWLTRRENERLDSLHQRALDERQQYERLRDRVDENDADANDTEDADASSGGTDRALGELLAELEITPVRKDVFDVLDGATREGAKFQSRQEVREWWRNEDDELLVDVREVVRDHAADTNHPADTGEEWFTSDRGHEITFRPAWRGSKSGESVAIPWVSDDPEDPSDPSVRNSFIDNACEAHVGPAKAYALGTGILPTADDPDKEDRQNAAAESLNGKQWADAVEGLRSEGYPIPMYVPEAGSETSDGDTYEKTPLWGLRKAAVALDVCEEEDFVEHETDDGDTYLGFEAPDYNAVLRALDEEGIDHGREPIDTDTRSGYYDVDLAAFVDDETDANPWTDPDTMLRACLRAREAGAISEHVAPPTMALLPLRRDVLQQRADADMNSGTRDLLEELFHDINSDELDDLLDDA